MKTLEELKAEEGILELQVNLYNLIKRDKLEKVKDFLKDYPLPEVFFEKIIDIYGNGKTLGSFFDPAITLGCAGIPYDYNKSFAMIEYFESLGLRADYEYLGMNALLVYIYEGGKESKVIEYFLSKGAIFEVYDYCDFTKTRSTMLHYWAMCNEAKILEVALKHGANPNVKEIPAKDADWASIGVTPLHLAARSQDNSIGACTKVLLKYETDVNAVMYSRYIRNEKTEYCHPKTPLDEANKYDLAKNIKLLKKAGAKTWKELVIEYDIDTSLEVHKQVEMYDERRKSK